MFAPLLLLFFHFVCQQFIPYLSLTDDEHARALEEQWIDSIDNAGSASLSQSSSSSNSAVLQGIILAFFFPFLPFFFMRKQRPAVFWDDGSEHESTSNVIFS
jgi:hypothetical protein